MATVLPATFGPLLRHLRLAAGLSQEALAQQAGLSVRAISDLERGARREPYPHTVRQLGRALGLAATDRARLEAAIPRRQRLAAPAGNGVERQQSLPAALTRLIGRERELAEVRRLLDETRLLTLTGAGGCGKSRLALAAVTDLAAAAPDGAHWIELAPLADSALVPATIAAALGVRMTTARPPLDLLADALAARPCLLALDNCEHLLEACAPLADSLLRACPSLRILVTSREPLAIAGEVAWPVPSLAVPPAAGPVEAIERAAAVQLFIERGRAVQPAFRLTAANARPVAEICRRLDGIPLALELAAARLGTLTAEQLAARLDDRFRLLATGSRAAPPRQQTLRATMDWSHALLTERERTLLRRLAVFAGGWELEAAEAVGAGGDISGADVLDLLGRLVAKSLVQVESPPQGGTRYRLLETVRQYAGEKLAESGEEAASRDRHADWFLALAERAEPALVGPEQAAWFVRFDAEHDNLRAALAWLRDTRSEVGVALVGAMWQYWYYRGLYQDGQGWLTSLLAGSAKPTLGRAKALIGAAWIVFDQGDPTTARALQEASLVVSRALGDTRCIAWALRDLAKVLMELGELKAARPLLEEALALIRRTDDRHGLRASLHFLGDVAALEGDYAQARAYVAESLADARREGAEGSAAVAHWRLGEIAYQQERLDEAAGHFAAALAMGEAGVVLYARFRLMAALGRVTLRRGDLAEAEQSLRDSQALAEAARAQGRLLFLGEVPLAFGELAWRRGDATEATMWLQRALAARHEARDLYGIAESLEALAIVAAGAGQPDRAARLLAATDAWRATVGAPLPPIARPDVEATLQAARTALGEDAFAMACAAGQALTLEQAMAEALAFEPAG